MKKTFIIPTTILFLFSCMPGCGDRTVTIASYNVDNLFDDIDNGTEYSEYDPGCGKWTKALYQKKLESVLKAIRSIPEMPDVLCLQEIENRNILENLKARLDYQWAVVPPASDSAVTVGILSRVPIIRTAAHTVPNFNGNPVRDILETELSINGIPVVLFNCHWKSRSGGSAATEPSRLFSSETLKNRIETLLAGNPGLHIIIAGDLNECRNEYDLIKRAYQTALIPPDAAASEAYKLSSIFQSDDLSYSGIQNRALVVFQPWFTMNSLPDGSYVYRKRWETIDHILLAGDFSTNSTIIFHRFFVHSAPELVREDTGFPLIWSVKYPDKGASDHLPVVLELKIPS